MKFLLLIFSITFVFTSQSFARGSSCKEPTTQQLKKFFHNSTRWTEVDRDNKDIIAPGDKVLRFHVNFNTPEKTRATQGGNDLGKVEKVCYVSSSQLKVVTNRGTMNLVNNRGIIEVKVFGHTFFYKPNSQVRARTSEIKDLIPDYDFRDESVAI